MKVNGSASLRIFDLLDKKPAGDAGLKECFWFLRYAEETRAKY